MNFNFFENINQWINKNLSSRKGLFFIFSLFVCEFFLFIPLDFVILFIAKKYPSKKSLLSMVAAICSTISGFCGYLIGSLAFEVIRSWIFIFLSQSFFIKLTVAYKAYDNIVVFIGCLLPFPFKLIVISAGFCKLAIPSFLMSVFFARWIRFFLVSLLESKLNSKIFNILERRTAIAIGIITIAILVMAFLWTTN